MKEKSKQLPSSGETRKTNRTWHFLSNLNSLLLSKLLLLLIIPFMGTTSAWGATLDVTSNDTGTWTNGNFTVNLSNGTTYSDSTPHSIKIKSNSFTISTNGTETITGATIYYYTKSDYSEGGNAVITTSSVESSYASRITAVSTTDNVLTVTAGTTNNIYIWKVTVSYSSGGGSKSAGDFTFTTDEGSVYVGRTLDIKTGNYTTSDDGAITFSSSDNTIATVNVSTGVVTGVAAGEATITATQAEGTNRLSSSDTYTITVNAAPTQYTVTLASSPAAGGSVSGKYNTDDAYNGKAINDDFSSDDKVSENTKLTLTASPNTGYQFAGSWGGSSKTTATFTTAATTSNKTYTANFTAKTYTITLDGNGATTAGSANTTATYDSSTLTAITAPTKTDYNLTGYWTSTSGGEMIIDAGGELQASTTYTDGSGNWTNDGVVTLHAQWESAAAPTYSVTYHNNLDGASGSVTDGNTYEAGASVKTQANSFSKSGYTFLGWSTSSGYQSSYTTAGNNVTMVAGGLDLYAQWQIDGSISSSPASGSSVVSGQAVTTTATSTAATGIKYNQGASEYTVAQLIASGGSVGSKTLNWTLSQNAIGAQVFSAVLTDGTFYSAVLTQNYTIGVAAPVISCSSNTVTITSATNDASIYYTTDGSTPTNESALYSAPFAIGGTTTVKAIAIKSGSTSATTTQVCESGAAVTSLPVTIDFNASPFSTSTNFSGASGSTMSLTQNSHEVYFHGSNDKEFSIVSGSPNALRMNSNGATNHFIAIPMSNINGRIDIEIWAPYAQSSSFTIRAVLDTDHGTTVQSSAPSAIKTAALDVNDYKDGHFYFRMKDLTATSGVLYIGPASSSYKDFQKIKVTSPAHYLIPDKASVTMGDGSEPDTVTITNYSAYPVLVKTVPSYVTATFEPSTGVLVITPKAIGTEGAIELAVDTNGDGIATDTDLSIPVTVTGITNVTAPTSAVYDTSGGSYSPTLKELSVTATKSATGNTGTLAYQWYSNTVNSNTGGTVISGATDNTLSTDKIRTTDSEKAAFYYCVVSLPGDSCKSVASDVAYVLTSKSKRYFQMSNVAGNKSTSETEAIDITGQVIAGGVATYTKNTGDGKYVLRVNTQPHYFHANGNAVFKIELPSGTSVKSDDVISVTVNAINGTTRGVTISANSDFSSSTDFTTSSNVGTVVAKTASAANLTGATTLYIKGYNGADSYFTDLILSESAPLVVSAPTPASQSIQTGDTPATISVTASGGDGDYSYQWYSNASASTSGATPITGATSASYTPPTAAAAVTTYYYCLVEDQDAPTGYAYVTVSALSHGYMTIDGTAHEELTFSFDAKGECTYWTSQDYYNDQNKASATQYTNFWSYSGSGTKWEEKTIGGTKDTYLRLKKSGDKMVFYVKNATAFSFMTTKVDGYTLTVNVDEEEIGTFSTDGNETELIPLLKDGSKIEISGPASDKDIHIGHLTFYENMPATITVLKNGEAVTEATQYMGDGATEYEVETNGDGDLSLKVPDGATPITDGYQTEYVSVTFTDGILSVTPLAATPTNPSTPEEITIKHTGGTSYADASTTLNVTVKKHTLALAFSYEKASFKASTLTESTVIPSGSLPTLTATLDGEVVDLATIATLGNAIQYKTDDRTIGYFGSTDSPASSRSADGTSYAVKYGGGQGGARIYAYVDNRLNTNYSSAKASFDLVVEDGTSNALPKGLSIAEQQVFRLANSSGVEVVKLTYGGYKYNPEGGWYNSVSRGEYYIDGYQYYTRHGMDALDEYGYQLRGMSDEAEAAPSGSESGDKIKVTKKKAKKDGESSVIFDVYKYSSQNVGAHTFWYTEAETRPDGQHYLPYQRIRPFTLPTRGGYLKFEPKQTGKLTVYVWQNGQMESKDNSNPDRVGSKPRLGYWFDQDGWVQKPTLAPITKQPITSESYASDVWAGGVRSKMTSIWTTDDDKPAINMLTYQYCDDAENPTSYSETIDAGHTDLNPYFWKTREQINTNLDEEKTIISEKMTPVPFHNGYMVPENSYLKYVINVVAGKTYYFYGMMTKIGYVGMNFVQDDNVTISDTGKKFYHETKDALHLNANDNMATVVANSDQGAPATYLGTVYDEVTLPSNYKKGQWSTICLPFPLSEEQVEEAFGKGTQLTIYNGAIRKSEGIFSVKYLSHVDRNILAGQPYFIKPSGVDANGADLDNVNGVIGSAVEGADGTRITFNTVCIDANFSTTTTYGSNKDVNASGTDIHQEGYKFVGAYNHETLPTYSYIVSKGELRRFTGSTTKIPTYYAYLKPNTEAAQSGSYSLKVDFSEEDIESTWVVEDDDDTPTGTISMEAIADAMNNGKVLSGKAYNMMGQEVDPTSAKGIVIIDGKKYMFK